MGNRIKEELQMKIRQRSIVGIGIEVLWLICFIGIFTQAITISGIVIWVMCLLGLAGTTKVINNYIK